MKNVKKSFLLVNNEGIFMTDSEIIRAEDILRSSTVYTKDQIEQATATIVDAIVNHGYVLANFNRLDDFDIEET